MREFVMITAALILVIVLGEIAARGRGISIVRNNQCLRREYIHLQFFLTGGRSVTFQRECSTTYLAGQREVADTTPSRSHAWQEWATRLSIPVEN